eukprot:CAMPEP_0170519016 /NCGR_PEP_ID=MMETSP0209-20121228/4570_1 /TAXON_ID=665100 ORGANISM="Litonotus pictus, Strain P1" /NCGR_SAMPLE_ID=MMETSP0209 /ASSEMBLY_ACC=CAM_ASM_000301 /LENGTH=314 /DNA_ID=CAMNT_0010804783 /DNA_START=185 /DNA_END=1129 /DNA_ORIENTATION=-
MIDNDLLRAFKDTVNTSNAGIKVSFPCLEHKHNSISTSMSQENRNKEQNEYLGILVAVRKGQMLKELTVRKFSEVELHKFLYSLDLEDYSDNEELLGNLKELLPKDYVTKANQKRLKSAHLSFIKLLNGLISTHKKARKNLSHIRNRTHNENKSKGSSASSSSVKQSHLKSKKKAKEEGSSKGKSNSNGSNGSNGNGIGVGIDSISSSEETTELSTAFIQNTKKIMNFNHKTHLTSYLIVDKMEKVKEKPNKGIRFLISFGMLLASSIISFLLVKSSVDWATYSKGELNRFNEAKSKEIAEIINEKFSYVRRND